MSKNKDEKGSGSAFKLLLRILSFVKPFSALLFLSILLNTIFSAINALTIALIKPLFQIIFDQKLTDSIVPAPTNDFFEGLKNAFFGFLRQVIENPTDKVATLLNLALLIISVFIIKHIFKYLSTVANVKLQEGVVKSIRDIVFDKMTSLSIDFFAKSREGSLISIISNDVTVVNSTTITAIIGMLREIVQVIIYIFLLISISSYLTFIALITSLVSLLILKFGVKYLRRYASRMQIAMADYTTILQETISGIRVVKAYNAEKTALGKFLGQTARYVKSAIKYEKILAIIPSLNEILAIIALSIVVIIGGSQVLNGEMTADELMLFLFTLFAIMSPVGTLFHNLSQFQRGIVAGERIFKILDQEPTVQDGLEKLEKFEDKISIENVSFAYDNQMIIKNANFDIPKGKKIALVGASGSGKSTMLDLIIRFYDPTEGKIKIDGKDIRNLNIASYRSIFGIVSQETMLFNDTISNNIKYGVLEVHQNSIEESARLANAYDFITKLPKGFETEIGDRGILLSGGERQRIAIARALVRNPQILIFDEATSSLDAESEKIVQEAINKSLENRTAIIVAHRLSTIIDCDEILVFDNGEILERGSHNELIQKNGIYKKLFEIQFSQPNNNIA